ncbi:TetR family transcriptional regulator C-terminal domain-containing protein [Microbacterium sp.]|uniref:TetR family transcriptional regulator C-terminal domain-containing protein n=1 Tax=Microbacterium sp. TaxID=51671 RepID=UPI002810C25D|nr:TetR family transcriptional regulator C-terminal domain-containing protein [Microbacterium sp.]
MSRTADHPARRRQIQDGVRAVALAGGLGAVTVARTAAAAGVSVGLVQHYYASKEELLSNTQRDMMHDVVARVDAAIAREERRHARIEHMMRAGLEELLPLDQRRREEVYLRRAFAGMALDHQALSEHQARSDDLLRQRIVDGVLNATRCGETRADVDAPFEAYALLALTDGLAAHLLSATGASQRCWARASLAARLADLFPGRCSRESSTN